MKVAAYYLIVGLHPTIDYIVPFQGFGEISFCLARSPERATYKTTMSVARR